MVKNWSFGPRFESRQKKDFFLVWKIATFSYCVTEGIVASLIAAIPQCQTQPIELVYFALAESTSTQCREKKSAGSDGNHLENTDQNAHLLDTCHTCVTWGFFSRTVSKRINEKQTRQLKNQSGFFIHYFKSLIFVRKFNSSLFRHSRKKTKNLKFFFDFSLDVFRRFFWIFFLNFFGIYKNLTKIQNLQSNWV